MINKTLGFLFLSVVAFSATARAQSASGEDAREKDRAEIRAHIESIFQAFIDSDTDRIRATHSDDWRGFLEGSRTAIKGIDEYMRANGIEWPKRDKDSKPTPNPSVGYEVKDFDVVFESPDVAVASFIGEFQRKNTEPIVTLNRFRIMDVYGKRDGHWIQVASHTVVDPAWRAERNALPANVPPEVRQKILKAREEVWRAYFSNDRAALERLIPADTIAIDGGSDAWSDRASILEGARNFAESGGKLVKLEFPKTEMQVYGNTVIIYTTYLTEIEVGGQHITRTGRGTEIFVQRDGTLVNVGWHLDTGK